MKAIITDSDRTLLHTDKSVNKHLTEIKMNIEIYRKYMTAEMLMGPNSLRILEELLIKLLFSVVLTRKASSPQPSILIIS